MLHTMDMFPEVHHDQVQTDGMLCEVRAAAKAPSGLMMFGAGTYIRGYNRNIYIYIYIIHN